MLEAKPKSLPASLSASSVHRGEPRPQERQFYCSYAPNLVIEIAIGFSKAENREQGEERGQK